MDNGKVKNEADKIEAYFRSGIVPDMISARLTLVVFLRVGLRYHPKETKTLLFIRHVSFNYIPGCFVGPGL